MGGWSGIVSFRVGEDMKMELKSRSMRVFDATDILAHLSIICSEHLNVQAEASRRPAFIRWNKVPGKIL
jgi:hypothetical protein